ncbi:MAG: NADH-quinone oxidoreductase subunit C [Ramlibacter sp.]|nr:NADH-quinone oxidoreductase subunit C [Ramlibacter sp.]
MDLPGIHTDLVRLPGVLPIWRGAVDATGWQLAAGTMAKAGGRLVALWASDRGASRGTSVCAAYASASGLVWLELPLAPGASGYPDLSRTFPAAGRMQRAAFDLSGARAVGAADHRPWLNHGAWPADHFPLREGAACAAGPLMDYPFVRVEGDGVHEIAVGPVHAGIIEPGHFRFSVVGEKVLRLEERLGYTHKGIEKRFTQLAPLEGHRLAGRVSGDTTVAYAWAYCMALESAAGCEIPPRAQWLRALMLERERVANHLGDLGALGNDAALGVALAQFSRLKEDWLRLSMQLFGHRFMMDCVVPGGVAGDVDAAAAARLSQQCDTIEAELLALRTIYDEHAGLQDRFAGTGRVSAELAVRLGLTGLAARASAQPRDLRRDQPWPPYDALAVKVAIHPAGDVAARVAVRFDEAFESLRLIRAMASGLPAGATRVDVRLEPVDAFGAGWVEGWRGEVLVALELTAQGADVRIRRCHCHDPSWQNWPVIEHAVIGNIVPDFPLINKSFNLSYSGQDL